MGYLVMAVLYHWPLEWLESYLQEILVLNFLLDYYILDVLL